MKKIVKNQKNQNKLKKKRKKQKLVVENVKKKHTKKE